MRQNFLFYYTAKRFSLLHILLTAFLGMILLNSCVAVKTSAYFKTLTKDTTLHGFITNYFESKIQKKDLLGISVSSMNKDLDDRFNLVAVAPAPGQLVTTAGYLVDSLGFINVHFAGPIKAAGLTRKELKQQLEQALLPYMKEPIITVQYLNHKITVLGEVSRPQVINMPEEQLSLIDV